MSTAAAAFELGTPGPAASLAEQAYRLLQARIVTLDLAPGAVISEDEVASRLGLGRTPVREALQRLNLEGLVTIVPRRGTFVSEITITDLAAIYEVRVPLEETAARLAAQRTVEDDQPRIATALADLAAAADTRDHDELLRLDRRLHLVVYELARNDYLRQTLERYLNLSVRILFAVLRRRPELAAPLLADALETHAGLFEAIRTGKGDRAETIARDHVRSFETRLRQAL